MAKQPDTLEETTPKKQGVSLRDLSPRKETKGGAAGKTKSRESPIVPGSLEEFLGSDSLQIER